MKLDHKLSPEQLEVLALLAEEASEVVKCVTKIIRFGLLSRDYANHLSVSNINDLCQELGDLEAAKTMCEKYIPGFSTDLIKLSKMSKLGKMDMFLYHAEAPKQ